MKKDIDNDKGLVSIVVPVYNVERYLKRCVDSITCQSYSNLEIILVDDGSSDSSGRLCDEIRTIDDRIVVLHQKNQGLSGARNAGLLVAKGEYIAFVDSDDWIDINFVSIMLQIMKQQQADIVSCQFRYTDEYKQSETELSDIKSEVIDKDTIAEQYLLCALRGIGSNASCCTKLYRAEIIQGILFNTELIFEDIIFNWYVLKKCCRFVRIDGALYHYYFNHDSITHKEFSEKNYDLTTGADIILTDTQNMSRTVRKLAYQYRCRTDFSILIKMFRSRNVSSEAVAKQVSLVKKDFSTLFFARLPFSRKIALLLVKLMPTFVCRWGRKV